MAEGGRYMFPRGCARDLCLQKRRMRIPSETAAELACFARSLKRESDSAMPLLSDPVGSRQDPAREFREALSKTRPSTEAYLSGSVGSRSGSRLFSEKLQAGDLFSDAAPVGSRRNPSGSRT